MNEQSDAALIEQCRSGDRRAFEAILDRYERQLFGAAFRILHDREDAFDVTQTAFMKAFEHLDRYNPERQFHSWLYRIAVNEALDLARSRRPSQELVEQTIDESEGPDLMAIREQGDAAMQVALMELKIEYRTVIVLKHIQGCSYEEMAHILDCPVKTVKSRLFTARQALRDILVGKGGL